MRHLIKSLLPGCVLLLVCALLLTGCQLPGKQKDERFPVKMTAVYIPDADNIYGAIISCIVGAFLVLIESPMQAIGFMAFILILQQLETNLIYPRVVSTSINLPSMWVLLAVTVGGGIFGIAGMLTAVPVTSIAYTLISEAANKRLGQRGLSLYDPSPRD